MKQIQARFYYLYNASRVNVVVRRKDNCDVALERARPDISITFGVLIVVL